MSLTTYRRKRDFGKTPEPSDGDLPSSAPAGDHRFVVQRHRATRLHYDFRLEIDGVLASWAVPRGPSLNPADKRMAVHVEDHPLSYFDFEGTIPKGEYGGGDVIVWDWGTWEPEETDDPGKAVASGELKFRLNGEKLRGRFTIVKTRGYNSGKDDWLLIHKRDDDADASWDVDKLPQSVKTGRTNDEVKAGADAVWDSRAPAEEASIDLSGAKKRALPEFIEPMKATSVDQPFDDDDWLFELKLDGYRIEAVVDKGRVRLWTRNHQDAARYFPDLASAAPTWINAETAIVDGEVVALDENGVPTFSLLQDRAGHGALWAARRGDRQSQAKARPQLHRPRRLLRLRHHLPRRPTAGRRPSRRAQEAAAQRAPRQRPGALRLAHRGRRQGFLRCGEEAGPWRASSPSCAAARTSPGDDRSHGSRSSTGANRRPSSSGTSPGRARTPTSAR